MKSKHALTSPFWSRDGQVIFYVENTARSVGYFISTEPVIPVGGGDSPADARPAQTASRSTTPAIAPDFSASDLSGERVNLEQLKGKVTVLHFWSTLRECEEDLHILQRLGDRYGNRGLSVVGLADNCTSREVVRSFLAKRGIRMTTLMSSPEIAGRYHVATHPTTYVLDETGKIRYWMYGILTEEHWAKQIERLLN